MSRIKIVNIILLCIVLFAATDTLYAKSKKRPKGKKTETVEASKKETPYEKVFKDKKAQTKKGLFTLHKIDDKVYFEVPLTLLGKRLLMGTMVESVSDPLESAVGFQPTPPEIVFFDKTDSLALIYKVSDNYRSKERESIGEAIAKSHRPVIDVAFPIIGLSPDSTAILFEASSFFAKDDKSLNPLAPDAYNAMEGYVIRTGSFVSSNSMISGIAAFDDNVSVTSCMSYTVKSALLGIFAGEVDKLLTANVKRTFLLLPEEGMSPRFADSRIGTSFSRYIEYSDEQMGARPKYYANRWKLEPENPEAIAQGGLSSLKSPIVFYIDDNFPELWKNAIEESFRLWNKAFEEIGFKDAIQTKEFPADSTEFDSANIKYSCVRYLVSPAKTVTDNMWADPGTGEIMSANIYVSHNLPVIIQRDRFLQTAGADPNVRSLYLTDEELAKAITAKMLRHIGHCLGLSDNMAASFAFPIDSLRSAEFTNRYGISSSVMDELPYNFIATADDFNNGVKMMQDSPGVYDYYAIKWLYSVIDGAGGPEDELPVLKSWIEDKQEDPAYRYGKAQNSKVFYDPRAMGYDLGGDRIGSVMYGMNGLAEVIRHADEWLNEEDYDYEYRQALYDEVVVQIYEYVKQVFVNVGGIYLNEKYAGDPDPTYVSVPKEIQRSSLKWIMEQISDLSWLEEEGLVANVGLIGSAADFCQKYFSLFIFTQIDAMWLSESKSEDPYTQIEAIQDVSECIWRGSANGKKPSDVQKFQQGLMIDNLIFWSNVEGSKPTASDSSASSSKPAVRLSDQSIGVIPIESYSGMMQMKEVRFKNTPAKEHLWYGVLLEQKQKIQSAARAAETEDTRHHYLYLLHKIDKAIKKN